jgi:hypothetical protein
MRKLAIAASIAGIAALPAAAEATTYFNGSPTRGGYVIGSGYHIDTLQIFCAGKGYENRQLRFDTALRIGVSRKGRFSYSGTVYRYGPQGEPRGVHKGKVSGHVSRSRSVSIRWSLPGCGSGTSVAAVER